MKNDQILKREIKKVIIAPLQIIAALTVIAGVFALLFEVTYFAEFSWEIYFGRLLATAVGFWVFAMTFFSKGKRHAILLVHVLLLTIIASFASIIYQIPKSLFVNSHILALLIFTAAIFLSWDVKNQIVVAIYYNILFAGSILLSDSSIYFLPNMFSSVLFVGFISLMSIAASSINYNLRKKTIEKSLEAKEIFENSTEALFKARYNSQIITVNPSFVKLIGSSEGNNGVHPSINDLFIDSGDYNQFINELSSIGIIRNFITKIKSVDGYEIMASINARLTIDEKSQPIFIEGSIQDITERLEAEEKIKEYNLELKLVNDSKDKFFSIVAHDLISPFSVLLGYTEILTSEYDDLTDAERSQFIKDINSVASKSFSLLENLLDWSRIQTGRIQFDPFELGLFAVSADVMLLYEEGAKKKGIKLVNKIPSEHKVFADNNMLHAIFRNLVANAIKFTDQGGIVAIASEDEGDYFKISVMDSGVGMKESMVKDLFKIDIHHSTRGTRKEKGTGLGLVLCQEFIKKHNGKIWVESSPDRGSKFFFTLPKKNIFL